MGWNDTKTWIPGEMLRATDLNTYVSDNLDYLLTRLTGIQTLNEGADYTTTSGTFADVDSTDLSITITPQSSYVKVHFHCMLGQTGGTTGSTLLDTTKDGTRVAGDDGITGVRGGVLIQPVSFTRKIAVTPNVSTVFRIQWKTTNSGAVMYAGAGTTGLDVHPQFWVEEA